MEKLQPWMRWLAAAGAVGALALALIAPRHPESAPTADDSPPPAAPVASTSPMTTSEPSPSDVAVYVCGAVRKAGVYRVVPGSRIADAVRQAGGLAADADPEAINLAEPVVDGMKIDVLKKGAETRDPGGAGSSRPSSSSRRSARHSGNSTRSGSHKLQPGQTLDINTATVDELTQLPGVGPSLARRIVEYREANGPFQTVDDLQNVSGIGPSKFAKLEPFVHL